jgi:hypothetical protein
MLKFPSLYIAWFELIFLVLNLVLPSTYPFNLGIRKGSFQSHFLSKE